MIHMLRVLFCNLFCFTSKTFPTPLLFCIKVADSDVKNFGGLRARIRSVVTFIANLDIFYRPPPLVQN